MLRKLFLGAALAALPIGLLVTIAETSAQAASPVTFKGNISCSLIGTVTFSPPLSNSQTTRATTATFKGTNNLCKGLDGTKLTQGGETLKSSKESFKFTIPANAKGSCNGLSSGVAPAITGAVVDWIGTSPITPTGLSFPAGTIKPVPAPHASIEYLNGTSTGSFAGTAQVDLETSLTDAAILKDCKTTAGLKSLKLIQPKPEPKPFGVNDNLEIGPLF